LKHRGCLAVLAFVLVSSASVFPEVSFDGIWAYLMKGEEQFLDMGYPITDIGYFGAEIDCFGHLTGVPDPKNLAEFGGRKHLVVAEVTNKALTHFCIDPAYPVRDRLIGMIALSSEDYDGVQIDFEMVSPEDTENFMQFLAMVKSVIGPRKALSVAVPARVRTITDAYDYKRIAAIADKLIVMAYDEHWSGSAPGPIASMDWCRRVTEYALSQMDRDKLVMGMPFYGRAWTETKLAKAYKFSGLETLRKDKAIRKIARKEGIPWFEYRETVAVKVFFEDVQSIVSRSGMYRDSGVREVSFWRLGQEDPDVWKELSIEKAVGVLQN